MNSANPLPSGPSRPIPPPSQSTSRATLWAGFGALAIAIAVGVTVATISGPDETATVLKVVDGNSVDVTLDGKTVQVHLRNVAVPSAADPDALARCLGPESAEFLESKLPIGSTVRLERGVDQPDGMLAGVYLDDTFINEEVARAGLGVAVPTDDGDDDGDDFYDTVLAANSEAVEAERGVYSTDIPCTVAYLVKHYEDDALGLGLAAGEAAGRTLAALNDLVDDGSHLADQVAHLFAVVSEPDESVFPMLAFATEPTRSTLVPEVADMLTGITSRISAAQSTIATAITTKEEEIAAETARVAEAARIAEEERVAEAARVAEEERLAAEAAAAAQRAADAAAQRAANAAAQRAANAATPRPKAPSTSGGTDTYTGCRAYGPHGTSLDNKGRRYTKISCN